MNSPDPAMLNDAATDPGDTTTHSANAPSETDSKQEAQSSSDRDPEAHVASESWAASKTRLIGLAAFTLILTALFWKPLLDLAVLAQNSDLYSHVFLVPLILRRSA